MMDSLPLKDIHLPPAVSFWPIAPGWWLLAIGLPLLLFGLFKLYRRITRQTAVKQARPVLAAIRHHPQLDDLQKLAELSALLRRVAISLAPRREVASLTGEAWLHYLDTSLMNTKAARKKYDYPFSKGVGRCLANAHFQRTAPDALEWDALFALCEQWLKQQAER
jgi:hypothetical protein